MIKTVFAIIAVSITAFLVFGSLSEFAVITVEDVLATLQNTVNDGQVESGRVTFFHRLAGAAGTSH